MHWEIKHFQDLEVQELYQILALRAEIFVVEQDCIYQDCDGKDINSYHVMGKNDYGDLAAYLRVIPPEISYDEASIGRVVVKKDYRRSRIGQELLEQGIQWIKRNFTGNSIRISAQAYITAYYEKVGFAIVSDEYLEDGIPHVEMFLKYEDG